MKPRHLMWVGFIAAIFAAVVEITGFPGLSISVLGFAGGALFGKGYGVWETRLALEAQNGK